MNYPPIYDSLSICVLLNATAIQFSCRGFGSRIIIIRCCVVEYSSPGSVVSVKEGHDLSPGRVDTILHNRGK